MSECSFVITIVWRVVVVAPSGGGGGGDIGGGVVLIPRPAWRGKC